MNRTKIITLFVGLIIVLGLGFIYALQLGTKKSIQLENVQAPTFVLTTFEGETISLADLKGQVVVVNFWASWCVQCYDEAVYLEEAYQDYKDRQVMFIGIDYLDTDKEAQKYMQRFGITYPSGMDMGSNIAEDYYITGVPETFFIDKKGLIRHVQIGPIHKPQLYQIIEELVSE
ncbi:MAG: hypothetical protein B6242_08210 [Anaerolineaceae bacterium 4572_78]|nr:MAG: hypothetical protein B6242_08210 [Anaerolineaceae bacterium 4572_78]